MRRLALIWFPIAIFLLQTVPAEAQDMKILTRVFSRQPSETGELREEQRAVTLTIFHGGRVYDYIDSVGEVIVFEPAHNRFTIMSSSRSLVTTVDFDELRQMLKVARHETEKYLDQLESKYNGQLPKSAEALRAQLDPQFDESWDPRAKVLTLNSPLFRYHARCEAAEDLATNDAYLRYADWIARLNFVLHPQSMFPEPRILVNESLRKRKLYPLQVELQIDGETRTQLRAEHKISWQLDGTDRGLIHEWETRLQRESLQKVSFREYQRAILVSASAK